MSSTLARHNPAELCVGEFNHLLLPNGLQFRARRVLDSSSNKLGGGVLMAYVRGRVIVFL